MKTIIHVVDIDAPREKVFNAITTEGGLSNWWTTVVSVQEGLGGIIDFRFIEGFNPDMKVTHLDQNRLLHWQCVGGHRNWQDNTFSFELKDLEAKSRLIFRQNYSVELDDEVYGTYNFNWAYYLDSLRLYCETGSGKPFQA